MKLQPPGLLCAKVNHLHGQKLRTYSEVEKAFTVMDKGQFQLQQQATSWHLLSAMWITGGKDMLLLLHAEVIQLCDH